MKSVHGHHFSALYLASTCSVSVCLKSTGPVELLGDDFVYSAHSLGSTPDTVFLRRSRRLFVHEEVAHLEFGHYFLARYLASFGVEVSRAQYTVWTFRILWFDSGYCSYVSSRRLMEVIRTFSRWRTLDPVVDSRRPWRA